MQISISLMSCQVINCKFIISAWKIQKNFQTSSLISEWHLYSRHYQHFMTRQIIFIIHHFTYINKILYIYMNVTRMYLTNSKLIFNTTKQKNSIAVLNKLIKKKYIRVKIYLFYFLTYKSKTINWWSYLTFTFYKYGIHITLRHTKSKWPYLEKKVLLPSSWILF